MKRSGCTFSWKQLAAALAFVAVTALAAESPREKLLFDSGWKFHLGNDWGSALDLMKAGANFGAAFVGASGRIPGFSGARFGFGVGAAGPDAGGAAG